MKKIKILIVDDHQILEQGIVGRVEGCFDHVQCYFSSTIRTAIAVLNQQQINLIISDLEFGNSHDTDGYYLIEYLKDIGRRVRSIALTHHNSYRVMKRAINFGFNSFLDKSCTEEDFINTVTQVYNNSIEDVYYSDSMKLLLKRKNEYYKDVFSDSLIGLSNLSARELELARLSVQTTGRKELAELMKIEPTTLDTHTKYTLSKLKLKNRKELALFAAEFLDEIKKFQ